MTDLVLLSSKHESSTHPQENIPMTDMVIKKKIHGAGGPGPRPPD